MTNHRKVLFLDRDGVINIDPGDYTWEPEKFVLCPDLIPFLKRMKSAGYGFIVITNQGGIAKGIYTMRDVEACHDKLHKLLEEYDLSLLDIFVSPHHDSVCRSLDRKPSPLMLERARALYNIHEGIMIGDKPSDVQAAESAGFQGLLIERNSSLLALADSLV